MSSTILLIAARWGDESDDDRGERAGADGDGWLVLVFATVSCPRYGKEVTFQ